MLIYWLAIWASLFLYSTVVMLPNISANGHVVKKVTCLEEVTAGRFDESSECVEYGPPYYVPVGDELKNNFNNYGVGSFFGVLIIGLFLMRGKKIQPINSNDQ